MWNACWAALVHSGWSSTRCAWFIHRWFHRTIPSRGWYWVACEWKKLTHTVRQASLGSPIEYTAAVPRDVQECLVRLAEKDPRDGFAFSRSGRSLPLAPKSVVKKTVDQAIEMSKGKTTTSEFWRGKIREFMRLKSKDMGFVARRSHPSRLPSSQSSCYEWPATRGGVDGFLFALGSVAEAGLIDCDLHCRTKCKDCIATQARNVALKKVVGEAVPSKADLIGAIGVDSLGNFLRKKSEVILFGTGVSEDIREAYRAVGVIFLRWLRSQKGLGPQMKLVPLLSPGLKVRVIGVPDALTFIEGSWIRESCPMLARGHWVVTPGPRGVPPELRFRRGSTFVSVDLSKATDGLNHDAIREVVEGLHEAGAIRPADLPLALRSLGLEPLTAWHYNGATWYARRGSPMGTPLSFVVLSWLNAFATDAFSSSRHHGDDAVGRADDSEEITDYSIAVAAIGASLNLTKTFTSPHSWTMCEVLYGTRQGQRKGSIFVPPPCPAPGLKAPVAAESRCDNRYLKRQERVMKALFPWITKDPRLHLPVEVGGLGYLGRGLAVGVGVRCRLAALVSRGADWLIARNLHAKRAFREGGLYPKSLISTPRQPADYWKLRREMEPLVDPVGGVEVPAEQLIAYENRLVESTYRLMHGDALRRVRDSGRPVRTKAKTLFRQRTVTNVPPLRKWGGIMALRRWAERLKDLPVKVFADVALEIRGSTSSPMGQT